MSGAIVLGILLLGALFPSALMARVDLLNSTRHSSSDLEVSGDIENLPHGAVRFITYEHLLKLQQVQYTVSDDSNFAPGTRISGVPLDSLTHALGAARDADLVVAICSDKYRTNYPQSYVVDHQPLLVLKMNGKMPRDWPPAPFGGALGPYLISSPTFTPSFKIFSHIDERQIPSGVVRIEFRRASQVLGAIRPPGIYSDKSPVMQGYRIAQQNCYRCHNMDSEGGQKAGRPWKVLAVWAVADPDHFDSYVRTPQATNPQNKMEGSPQYDDSTLGLLRAYFSAFVPEAKE